MVITKWSVSSPLQVFPSSELDGLLPGAYSPLSVEVDGMGFTHLWFELFLPAFSVSTEGVIEVYLLPKFDSDYVLGGPGVIPPRNTLVGAYVVTGSLVKRLVTEVPVQIPPFPFKFLVKNNTRAVLPSGGTLKVRCGCLTNVEE